MTVKITQLDGWKFKAEADGFTVISGRVDKKSDAEGMSPGTLMAASLGLCTGMHLVSYLKENNIEYSDLTLMVDNKSGKNPNRCVELTARISLKADLSDEQVKGLLEEANQCYVGNTIKGDTRINVQVKVD